MQNVLLMLICNLIYHESDNQKWFDKIDLDDLIINQSNIIKEFYFIYRLLYNKKILLKINTLNYRFQTISYLHYSFLYIYNYKWIFLFIIANKK